MLFVAATSCSVEELTEDDATAAGRLAEAQCSWIVACECGAFADEGVCRERLLELLQLEHATALDAGLVEDEDCLRSIVGAWEDRGCDPQSTAAPPSCAGGCALLHGALSLGEVCRWHGNFHDCRQGLACERDIDGVDRCAHPCGRLEGEPCRPVEHPMCDFRLDLVCAEVDAVTGTGTCVPRPGIGQPCLEQGCSTDGFCDVQSDEGPICRPLRDLGEPCIGGACEQGTFCDVTADEPICVAPPDLGEPCPLGACTSGAYCDANTSEPVCVPIKETREPCVEFYECRSEICEDGRCRATAMTPAICEHAQRLPPRL